MTDKSEIKVMFLTDGDWSKVHPVTVFVGDSCLPWKSDYPTQWEPQINEARIKASKEKQALLADQYDAAIAQNKLTQL